MKTKDNLLARLKRTYPGAVEMSGASLDDILTYINSLIEHENESDLVLELQDLCEEAKRIVSESHVTSEQIAPPYTPLQ